MNEFSLLGNSGQDYVFNIYKIHELLPDESGIYVFIKFHISAPVCIYIGQTHSFYERVYANLNTHHAWHCIKKNKATHIGILTVNGTEEERREVESDIITLHEYSYCNKE